MIEKEFNSICRFKTDNPPLKGNPIKTDDPIVKNVVDDLVSLKDKLKFHFNQYKGIDLNFEYSRGAANFPNILHVSILPPEQKVSDGIYVVICFDKYGRGAVAGCAESKTNPKGLEIIQRKISSKDTLSIDVDGSSQNTKYNNTFANPKEFYCEIESDTDLILHLQQSLDLVLFKLGLIDRKDLNINQLLISNKITAEFDPKDIEDARSKIASQIVIRQGQRKFRHTLLKAYNYACAITGCKIPQLLEAAHIVPYKGEKTDHIQNGILLRADIHTLFDLQLLSIDPDSFKIIVHQSLLDSEYKQYQDAKIFLPKKTEERPSGEALKNHSLLS